MIKIVMWLCYFLSAVCILAMFVLGFLAIWFPNGHATQYHNTIALLVFFTCVPGIGAYLSTCYWMDNKEL